LIKRLGLDNNFVKVIVNKAKRDPKRVVFAEADNYKILKAAQIVREDKIAIPILLGDKTKINQIIKDNKLDLKGVQIIDTWSPDQDSARESFGKALFEDRKRKGLTLYDANKLMRDRNYYGAMMVKAGDADVLISGLTRNYPDMIRPALQVIGTDTGVTKVAGMYIIMSKRGPMFFADTTINIEPSVDDLVEITTLTAKAVKQFNIQPRIAMLSYSNFGSNRGAEPERVRKAVEILKQRYPGMVVDGEMQANFAFNTELLKDNYPFSDLVDGGANTLIFPNLSSGNIAYKLMQEVGTFEAIGPILLGLKKPVHILQLGSSVREIINMITIAVVDAQSKSESK